MKHGDLRPSKFANAADNLVTSIKSVPVDKLASAEATQLVAQTSRLIEMLGSLRSQAALQVSRSQSKPTDPGFKERAVKNLFDNGTMSRSEVKHEANKAKLLEQLPSLNKNLSHIPSSNFDAATKHIARLKEEQLEQLDESLIVSKAKQLAPEQFEKALSYHITTTTSSLLEDTKRKRARSNVKHWLNSTTGMGHIHAKLDPERYERIANRIDREVSRLANLNKKATGSTANATKDAHLAADAFYSLLGSHPANSGSGTGNAKRSSPIT